MVIPLQQLPVKHCPQINKKFVLVAFEERTTEMKPTLKSVAGQPCIVSHLSEDIIIPINEFQNMVHAKTRAGKFL